MEDEKRAFLSPEYPWIIVSKLTDDVIRAAIESFINADNKSRINADNKSRWLAK